MTQEVDFSLQDDGPPMSAEEASDDEDVVVRKDRASVREMILRFEQTSINNSFRDSNESLAKSKDPLLGSLTSVVNPLQAHFQHLLYPVNRSQDRNSNVSVNSILSNASENSCESSSSGFVSDRKSGTDLIVPHRPAPPPPTPSIDDPLEDQPVSTAEKSTYVERRFSFTTPNTSPIVTRRARQPPVMRRKSTAESFGQQKNEAHWSYGVKQSDLEKLLRLKTSEISDNEDDTIVDIKNSSEKESSSDDSDSSDDSSSNGREYGLGDDNRADAVSTDHSTDTLINEDGDAEENNDGDDDISMASGESGARSNYDNVSIKSLSSFDMIPYQKYDSITVSSDEFGSEVCHAPDTEFLTVSAVNEWCVLNAAEPVLIPVETKKEKYRR